MTRAEVEAARAALREVDIRWGFVREMFSPDDPPEEVANMNCAIANALEALAAIDAGEVGA